MTRFDMKSLLRRTVEIDYANKHRHLPGSLSALTIIAGIYEHMGPDDVFILSKGHSCAALLPRSPGSARLPSKRLVSLVHPERDVANGVTITSGSLGHGLAIGVGIAYAKRVLGKPGLVHVLMGDGECHEGSVFEALLMARRFKLQYLLNVHVDHNGWQGSEALLADCSAPMRSIFPVTFHKTRKGQGIKRFEENPAQSVHLVTDQDYKEIMEEIA